MAMIRKILWLLATFLLAHVQLAAAQHPVKNARIGCLFFGSKDQPHLESFHQGLRDLGYVEGRNIAIEYRYAERSFERVGVLAAELVSLNLDAILTTTPAATRAVLQANSRTPIVSIGFDPVAAGLVKSLAYPDGIVTGLSSSAGPMGKRLDLPRRRSQKSPQSRCCGIPKLASLQRKFSKEQKRRPRLLETAPAA
jgi:putative tryptophan/tyrosine transport system substrate-binding protein